MNLTPQAALEAAWDEMAAAACARTTESDRSSGLADVRIAADGYAERARLAIDR